MGIFDFLKRSKNIENDNGLNETYYDNGRGNINNIFYKKNGDYHGKNITYNKDGTKESEFEWVNGKCISIKRYRNNILVEENTNPRGPKGNIKWDTKKYNNDGSQIILDKYPKKFSRFYDKINDVNLTEYNQEDTVIRKRKGEEYVYSKEVSYKNGKIGIKVLYPNLPVQYTLGELYKKRSIEVITFVNKNGIKFSTEEIIDFYLNKKNNDIILSLFGDKSVGIKWNEKLESFFVHSEYKTIEQSQQDFKKFLKKKDEEKENGVKQQVYQVINKNLFVVNYINGDVNTISLTEGEYNLDGSRIKQDQNKGNTLEKKEKRKLEKPKKEDTIKEKITDLEVSENKGNQCICFKDRRSLKFSHLQIYGSFKKEYKDWVVVDITKRKEVVFTSDSHDECKDWKDDKLILKGGDKLNGQHKYVHENGDVYEGEWKDGKKNGVGVLISSEHGDRYEGEWKDGKQNGIGTYKDSSGKIISGNWKNGDIKKEDMTYYKEKGKVLIEKKIN